MPAETKTLSSFMCVHKTHNEKYRTLFVNKMIFVFFAPFSLPLQFSDDDARTRNILLHLSSLYLHM